ncbi:hypothetical protein N7468_008820 [Penicillium chermesinum]|uniref:Uncharacterized protein n=1 Tax=Penicillium chermesinum TaxID=63820 RepID=A0A9W9NGN9_9EURO|nr:uncharacterized protein N7468_008820 [Penicillium chermesinum]KAJ5219616.1 hypothetical protein N7468_008820 [Penicillium chermesinum]KAJ6153627.1 hypothetical protein N7470_006586 [Penicillium chermesinum]
MGTNGPLFVAQETICYYPISTIYDACPRYLFYALLIASCVSRWTGWLADVFLGTAATYAGTAAIEAFILVANPAKIAAPAPVTIPYVPRNTTLLQDFPQLITETDYVLIQPAASELDIDAIMAIVVTGYLVFVPLQAWSRVLTKERARNVLFYLWNILMLAGSICALVYSANAANIPTHDGWQSSWRPSDWNSSVWMTFSNATNWAELGDICYNPCFNTSQILRKPTSLESATASESSELSHPNKLWSRLIYSRQYIYSLIVLCVVLNLVLLTFKWLPFRSHVPSAQIVPIWKERKAIWHGIKSEIRGAWPRNPQSPGKEESNPSSAEHSFWGRIRPFFSVRVIKALLRVVFDIAILICVIFSIIASPFTTIAFVVWAEWWIYNDGPSQESPQQVGQWSYLVAIALLVISAAVLTLKYRIASTTELNNEIARLEADLDRLRKRRDERMQSDRGL